jgi:hypothetical protein
MFCQSAGKYVECAPCGVWNDQLHWFCRVVLRHGDDGENAQEGGDKKTQRSILHKYPSK